MPTFNRKVRIMVDWFTVFALPREDIPMGQLPDSGAEFARAAWS